MPARNAPGNSGGPDQPRRGAAGTSGRGGVILVYPRPWAHPENRAVQTFAPGSRSAVGRAARPAGCNARDAD